MQCAKTLVADTQTASLKCLHRHSQLHTFSVSAAPNCPEFGRDVRRLAWMALALFSLALFFLFFWRIPAHWRASLTLPISEWHAALNFCTRQIWSVVFSPTRSGVTACTSVWLSRCRLYPDSALHVSSPAPRHSRPSSTESWDLIG